MTWDARQVSLEDERRFETLNGLWTGKKAPFATVGVIRNTNFTESGHVDYSDVAWLEVEQKQLSKRELHPGDIIVERSGGGPKQPVGRVVYFNREDGPFSFSNFMSAIRVLDTHAFDQKFVFYSLLELYQSGRTEDIQRRTTGIRNLDFTAYKERACFPLIPLTEQQKIASVLGLVQQAIEQQVRLIALSQELKVNPNTAHKVVAALVGEGVLVTTPAVGSIVAERELGGKKERAALLGAEVEWLVVEAKKLGLDLDDVQEAVAAHWKKLGGR